MIGSIRMKMLILGVATIVLLVASLLYSMVRIETVETEYQTYQDVLQTKATGPSSWLPDWLPTASVRIREVHNVDTNQVWVEFDLTAVDALPTEKCQLLSSDVYAFLAKLPEKLAKKVGTDPGGIAQERDSVYYVCTASNRDRWSVVWRPAGSRVLSWNSPS